MVERGRLLDDLDVLRQPSPFHCFLCLRKYPAQMSCPSTVSASSQVLPKAPRRRVGQPARSASGWVFVVPNAVLKAIRDMGDGASPSKSLAWLVYSISISLELCQLVLPRYIAKRSGRANEFQWPHLMVLADRAPHERPLQTGEK